MQNVFILSLGMWKLYEFLLSGWLLNCVLLRLSIVKFATSEHAPTLHR